jgi:hypothetical protein
LHSILFQLREGGSGFLHVAYKGHTFAVDDVNPASPKADFTWPILAIMSNLIDLASQPNAIQTSAPLRLLPIPGSWSWRTPSSISRQTDTGYYHIYCNDQLLGLCGPSALHLREFSEQRFKALDIGDEEWPCAPQTIMMLVPIGFYREPLVTLFDAMIFVVAAVVGAPS